MKSTHRLLIIAALAVLGTFEIGCSNWERTTFQTLSASKAVIDQAQVDYEGGTVIPHSKAAFDAINTAKATQRTAVDSMVVYEQIKAVNGTLSQLSQQEIIVDSALAALPKIVADVKALYIATNSQPLKASPSQSNAPTSIKEPN